MKSLAIVNILVLGSLVSVTADSSTSNERRRGPKSLKYRLRSLETAVTALQQDRASLRAIVNQQNDEIDALQASSSAQQVTISALEAQSANHQEQLAAHLTQINALGSESGAALTTFVA